MEATDIAQLEELFSQPIRVRWLASWFRVVPGEDQGRSGGKLSAPSTDAEMHNDGEGDQIMSRHKRLCKTFETDQDRRR